MAKKTISLRIWLVQPYRPLAYLVFFYENLCLAIESSVAKKNLQRKPQGSCLEQIVNTFFFVFLLFFANKKQQNFKIRGLTECSLKTQTK